MTKWRDPLTPGVRPGTTNRGVTERLAEGRVLTVSAAGATFSLPEFPAQTFGPAPWAFKSTGTTSGHSHDVQPEPGDRCLVGWAGVDRSPWILGWWS